MNVLIIWYSKGQCYFLKYMLFTCLPVSGTSYQSTNVWINDLYCNYQYNKNNLDFHKIFKSNCIKAIRFHEHLISYKGIGSFPPRNVPDKYKGVTNNFEHFSFCTLDFLFFHVLKYNQGKFKNLDSGFAISIILDYGMILMSGWKTLDLCGILCGRVWFVEL